MAAELKDEEWKIIYLEGYVESENYQLSNYGRVRRWKPNQKKHTYLKPTNVNGYHYMSFRCENDWQKRKTFSIHRMTADLFLEKPNTQGERFVIHLDYNKQNNDIKNLRYVDQLGLTLHNQKNPNVINSVRKGIITYSKLSEADVVKLKIKLRKGGDKLYKLAQEFGITHTQLNRIRKGENWGHVTIPDED